MGKSFYDSFKASKIELAGFEIVKVKKIGDDEEAIYQLNHAADVEAFNYFLERLEPCVIDYGYFKVSAKIGTILVLKTAMCKIKGQYVTFVFYHEKNKNS